MNREKRIRYLRVALMLFGLFCIFGLYLMMMIVWPNGWRWEPHQPEYEQMIVGLYATLGVFLVIASRDPLKHKSLIWFTVWSSIVHAGIMTVQAIVDPGDRIHLLGDIPALLLMAIVLAYLMPKTVKD
jgi:hypothetical protein